MVNKDNSTPEKLKEKITAMREGGKILGNLLRDLKNYVKPGMTGKEVDAWVRKEIVARGAKVGKIALAIVKRFSYSLFYVFDKLLVVGIMGELPMKVRSQRVQSHSANIKKRRGIPRVFFFSVLQV